MTERQKKFLEFVIIYHGSQARKYTHEAYWHHCLEVANLVSEHDKTPLLWEVGLGHDLLEDTTCTSNLLYATLLKFEYSQREAGLITGGVISLTDVYTKERFPDLNRMSRKQKEAQRLGKIRSEFQSVKYADLISNTKSISEHDPGFAKVYLKEKRELLNEMRNGNIDLLIKCCSILEVNYKKHDIHR